MTERPGSTLLGKEPASVDEPPGAQAILNALTAPLFVIDGQNRFTYANPAAQSFFSASLAALRGHGLDEFLSADSPIFGLAEQVRSRRQSISEYGIVLQGPRIGPHRVSADGVPLGDESGSIILSFGVTSIAQRIENQLTHRSAARSITAMAAILAHEIKNPLSGIRGAAQLLEHDATPDERDLTRLSCDEADRIVDLVDRMEMFGDERPLERRAVNIHEVLEYVRKLARSGFARHVRIVEDYDPSLPPVLGNRDFLIQAILNLVKNAAEAVPAQGGEITLSTRYRQGIRLALPGAQSRVDLPLVVAIQDNGPGIPDDLQRQLFDPFVTTKSGGTGLGLAVVAKVIGDHGGVVEFDSMPRRTVFRLLLPMASGDSTPDDLAAETSLPQPAEANTA